MMQLLVKVDMKPVTLFRIEYGVVKKNLNRKEHGAKIWR